MIEAIASSTIEYSGPECGNADNVSGEVDMLETWIESTSENALQSMLRRDLKGGEGDKEMYLNSPKATGKESNKVSKLGDHGSDVNEWNEVISGTITSCEESRPFSPSSRSSLIESISSADGRFENDIMLVSGLVLTCIVAEQQ